MPNTSVITRSLATTALAITAGLGAATITATPAAAAAAGGMEPTPASTPTAPYGVQTTCVWSNAVRVTWSRSWLSKGPTITNYEVAAFYTNGKQAASQTVHSWTTQTDLNRLRSGTRYQFKVRAKNSAGWGAWSKAVYATTSRY